MAAQKVAALTFLMNADTKRLVKGFNRARRRFRQFSYGMRKEFGGLAKAARTSTLAITAGFALAGRAALKEADRIAKTARSLALTAEEYQKLSFAFGQFGIEAEKGNKLLLRVAQLQFEAERGTKTYTDALTKMGVNYKEIIGIPLIDALEKIGAAFDKNKDKAGFLGAASLALGARMVGLLGTLSENVDQLGELGRRLEYVGGVIPSHLLPGAESINDAFDLAGKAISARFTTALLEALPPAQTYEETIRNLGEVVYQATQSILEFVNSLRQNLPVLLQWAKTLAIVLGTIKGVTAGTAIGAPFGGIGGVVGAVVGGVTGFTGSLVLLDQLEDAVQGIGNSWKNADKELEKYSRQVAALSATTMVGPQVADLGEVAPKFRDHFRQVAESLGLEIKEAVETGVKQGVKSGIESAIAELPENVIPFGDLDDPFNRARAAANRRRSFEAIDEAAGAEGFLPSRQRPDRPPSELFAEVIDIGKQLQKPFADLKEDTKQTFRDFGNNVREGLRTALLTGNFKDLGQAFVVALQSALIDNLLKIGGQLLSSFLGLGAGVGGAAKATASGRPNIGVGDMQLVGEMGPELFLPQARGAILPNRLLGGGGNQLVQNINIRQDGDFTREQRRFAVQYADLIADTTQQSLRERRVA